MRGAILAIGVGLAYLAWRAFLQRTPVMRNQWSGHGYATKEEALANLPIDASKNTTVVQDVTDRLWYIVSFGGFEYEAHQTAVAR